MSLRYVIDAYNLIKRTSISQSNNQINSLINFITMYKPQGRNKVTLVFDGYPALDFRSNRYPNIDVIFGRDKSADEIIKHILKDELVSKNLVVVSDDKEIVDKARFYNAKTISSKVFFDKVKNKFRQRNKNDLDDKIISYTEMHKINKELKEIWLRDSNKDEE